MSDIDKINSEITRLEQQVDFARKSGNISRSHQYISSLSKLKAEKEEIIWTQKRMEQSRQYKLEIEQLEQEKSELQEKLKQIETEFEKAKEKGEELEIVYRFLKEHPDINPKSFVSEYEKISRK